MGTSGVGDSVDSECDDVGETPKIKVYPRDNCGSGGGIE